MDVCSALVGVDGLEVADVADDLVFVHDPVASKHVAARPRDVESLRAGVPLHHGDHVRVKLSLLLHAGGLQHGVEADGDLCESVGHLHLDELVGREGALELVTVHGVLASSLQAELGSAPGTPGNTEAGGIQAGKGATHARDVRQHVLLGDLDLVEVDHARGRGPERKLALNLGRREALHATLDDEASHLAVCRRLGPDDADVRDRRVRDPVLGAAQQVVVPLVDGLGDHAAGVRAVVGLGKAEAAHELAGRQAGEEALLLLLGAEKVDGVHDQRGLH
mmetsp:Transcript_32716/g.77837  ORF Transcript_32716/g.77837 Transcript_32716/m.77837 type:complete len:278 (+) Transcript_32716:477-1310(+)